MAHRTRLHDLDAARQAYQFGRYSYRKDLMRGTATRNPYLAGSLFHRAFEEGRRLEANQPVRTPERGGGFAGAAVGALGGQE